MKRRKLWKTGEDGLCCSSSAIQIWPGPLSLLEEQSKTPIVFVVSLCCRLPPERGETAKIYRIDSFTPATTRLWKDFLRNAFSIPPSSSGEITN